ncbi:hypothetical protein [Halorarius litoreus]|nr:hypothetical protein [Halorarius litoreus]
MSEVRPRVDLDSLDAPICDTCGCRIDQPDQDCPARSDGVCAP